MANWVTKPGQITIFFCHFVKMLLQKIKITIVLLKENKDANDRD